MACARKRRTKRLATGGHARPVRASRASGAALDGTRNRQTGLQQAARQARYRLLREACRLGRASFICWWPIRPTTRPRRWPCVQRATVAPTGSPAWRRCSNGPMFGCSGRCSQCRGRAPVGDARRHDALPWIDDPSNGDPRFERARLRAGRSVVAAGPARDADRASVPIEEAQVAEAGVVLFGVRPGGGRVALDRAGYRETPVAICIAGWSAGSSRRWVAAIIRRGGTGSTGRWRDFPARLTAGKSGRRQDFTLSGCRFPLRQAGTSSSASLCGLSGLKMAGRRRSPRFPLLFSLAAAAAATHLDNSPT